MPISSTKINGSPENPDPRLATIAEQTEQLARNYAGDSGQLLTLLRLLEKLHRQIREGPFQESLPANRNDLYRFLRQLEVEGGWPYIPAIPLKKLLAQLEIVGDP